MARTQAWFSPNRLEIRDTRGFAVTQGDVDKSGPDDLAARSAGFEPVRATGGSTAMAG
jgi:hypothetical protein